MACHPAIRAFGVDFRTAEYRPDQLFDAAAGQTPSLVILEDIDKVGGRASTLLLREAGVGARRIGLRGPVLRPATEPGRPYVSGSPPCHRNVVAGSLASQWLTQRAVGAEVVSLFLLRLSSTTPAGSVRRWKNRPRCTSSRYRTNSLCRSAASECCSGAVQRERMSFFPARVTVSCFWSGQTPSSRSGERTSGRRVSPEVISPAPYF